MSNECFATWIAIGARTAAAPGCTDAVFQTHPFSPYWCLRLRLAALALSAKCEDAEWAEIIAALPEVSNPRDAFYLFEDILARRSFHAASLDGVMA